MPDFVWVVISVIGSIAAIVVIGLSIKRGFRATYRGSSIVIAGSMEGNQTPIGRSLQFVQVWTPEIQHTLFSMYLKLMKDQGADPDFLADYDDARFARALFRYLVSGGNGTKTIQKIIETEIIEGEWKRGENHVDAYVENNVWPLVVRTMRDFLNSEYDTTVLQKDGSRRTRWVSNTDLIDTVTGDAVKKKIINNITPIFRFAKQCINDGCV